MADAQQTIGLIVGQTDQNDQIPRQTDREEKLWTMPKLMERYGIGQELLYKRMAYLKIRPKEMGSCSYLNDEQLAHMDGLHDHIQRTGRIILLQKLRGVLT